MNFLLQLRYIDGIVQQSATAAGDASCSHGDQGHPPNEKTNVSIGVVELVLSLIGV